MRQFEIVLFGATGVTGANTAHYIAKNYPTLKWAIAGRNPSKLKDLLSKLPSAPDIVIADSSDPVSLEALTCQTKVVISTVGPFALYGEPLVAACVKTKTHYIDSTGETNFVMKIIQKYHEQASLDKTFVVPCCGFDCVPSDLGAFIAVYDFKKRGLTADAVHLAVMDASGGISGGTIASGMEMFESDPKERKMVMNPYCLVDDNGKIF